MVSISSSTEYFLNEPRNKMRNTTLLNLHISSMRVIAICPFKKETITSKLYAVVVFGILLCGTFFTGINRLLLFPRRSYVFERFLSVVTILILCVFFASILYSNLKNSKRWINLIRCLNKFDESKSNLMVDVKKWEFARFILLHIAPWIYGIIDYFIWESSSHGIFSPDVPLFFSQHSGLFYEIQLAAFFWEMSCLFEPRYRYLQNRLHNILPNKLSNAKFSKYMFDNEIRMIKHQYTILHSGIQELNVIFGWNILYLTFHILLRLLLNFYWTLVLIGRNNEIIIAITLLATSTWVSQNNFGTLNENIKLILTLIK